MARPGQVITDPVIGDRIVFHTTARETDGMLLQFDDFLPAGAVGPPEHIHIDNEERLTVGHGVMRVRVAGKERLLSAGEQVSIPPGTPHIWGNGGGDELLVHTEFRPAHEIETFFETLFGLARDGKVDAKGNPPLLQLAILCPKHSIYLTKPPVPLQKLLFTVLGPIARRRGYRATYPEYMDVSVDAPGENAATA